MHRERSSLIICAHFATGHTYLSSDFTLIKQLELGSVLDFAAFVELLAARTMRGFVSNFNNASTARD